MFPDDAEFDERYFPGLKHTPLTPEPFEPPPSVPFTCVPNLGGDDDSDTNPAQNDHVALPDTPHIAPVPLEPLPNIPETPPATPHANDVENSESYLVCSNYFILS